MTDRDTVLLTGATGFVGQHLLPTLVDTGVAVRCASRRPASTTEARPHIDWVKVDIAEAAELRRALEGCRTAYYLVHGMAEGKGYEARERNEARTFAEAAAACKVERIIYLGGIEPRGRPSRHLATRLATGKILRAGEVPVFELRASMIIGRGSASFQIVHDLAARLPAMILPRWLSTLSQPVAIDDIVFALNRAREVAVDRAGVYDLPGPETLSAKEILLRIARLRGTRPVTLSIPLLSPRLSSYWLKLITGTNYFVARELVEGLSSDIVTTAPEFWSFSPGHRRTGFDEAARRAMA